MKPYYIQDTRCYVGNSMTWWAKNDCGYVCDIRKAKVFTKTEAKEICSRPHTNKKMWPKEYIDARIEHHIDMQNCDYKQALKT